MFLALYSGPFVVRRKQSTGRNVRCVPGILTPRVHLVHETTHASRATHINLKQGVPAKIVSLLPGADSVQHRQGAVDANHVLALVQDISGLRVGHTGLPKSCHASKPDG